MAGYPPARGEEVLWRAEQHCHHHRLQFLRELGLDLGLLQKKLLRLLLQQQQKPSRSPPKIQFFQLPLQ